MKNLKLTRLLTNISLLVLCATGVSGCTIGYRYHHVDATVLSQAQASGTIEGSGHTMELGVILDFRYLRLIMPYLGASYEMDLSASDGSNAHQETMTETRGLRLDLPVLSVWNAEDGWSPGYPGIMVHRDSVELWLSATGRLSQPMLGFADLSLVYYHHNLVAVRAFGGWGVVPFHQTSARLGPQGLHHELWEVSAGGPTGGIELTVGAGEQALDFIKFFMDSQKAVEDEMR